MYALVSKNDGEVDLRIDWTLIMVSTTVPSARSMSLDLVPARWMKTQGKVTL